MMSRGASPIPILISPDCGKLATWKPWEGIVVENAPLGIHAGVAAGCFTIGINSGPLPDSDLLAEKPNLLYQKITELLDDWNKIIG